MNDEARPKSIKEELAEQKIIFTIEIGMDGGLKYSVNKPNTPSSFLRSNLMRVQEQMLADEIFHLCDQRYMKKMGLKRIGK